MRGALGTAPQGEAGMAANLRAVRRQGRPSRLSRSLASVLLLVAVIAGWAAASEAELVDPVIVPAPAEIWQGLRELLTSSFLLPHLWATTYETVLGFLIAAGASMVLAVVLSNWDFVRDVLYPYLVVFQILPKVALAPIFIAWLGFGAASKVVLAAAIAFSKRRAPGLDTGAVAGVAAPAADMTTTVSQGVLPTDTPIKLAIDAIDRWIYDLGDEEHAEREQLRDAKAQLESQSTA